MILVQNPSSRSGRGKNKWAYWHQRLNQDKRAFRVWQTSGELDAQRLATEVANQTVVAVGGDGTINTVISAAMTGGASQVGVLYAGTSPDFCQFHGIPTQLPQAMDLLLAGETKKIDLIKVEHLDFSLQMKVSWASCSCNLGLGAEVARLANRWRRFCGDTLGTLLAVLWSLLGGKKRDLKVVMDGQNYHFPAVNHLLICKNPWIASGLKVGLDLKSDDGKMAVVVVRGQNLWGMLTFLVSLYRGKMVMKRGVEIFWPQEIQVDDLSNGEVEYDGDPQGFVPFRATLVPQVLNLVVPKK